MNCMCKIVPYLADFLLLISGQLLLQLDVQIFCTYATKRIFSVRNQSPSAEDFVLASNQVPYNNAIEDSLHRPKN